MVRFILILLFLPGCVFVRLSANVEDVGKISKTVLAVGNAELQEVSQKLEGTLIKDNVIIQFGSQSNVRAVTKEEFLNFIGSLTSLL